MLRVKCSPWPRGAYGSAVGQALSLFCKRSFNYGDLIWENSASVCGLRAGLFGVRQLSPARTHTPALSQLQAAGQHIQTPRGSRKSGPLGKQKGRHHGYCESEGSGVSWDAARSCVQMVLNLSFWGWAGVSQVKARKAGGTAAGEAQSPERGNGHKWRVLRPPCAGASGPRLHTGVRGDWELVSQNREPDTQSSGRRPRGPGPRDVSPRTVWNRCWDPDHLSSPLAASLCPAVRWEGGIRPISKVGFSLNIFSVISSKMRLRATWENVGRPQGNLMKVCEVINYILMLNKFQQKHYFGCITEMTTNLPAAKKFRHNINVQMKR